MSLRLPTPDDARQPAIAERDLAELRRDRPEARPIPEGPAAHRLTLDDVMAGTSPRPATPMPSAPGSRGRR
jgi:hypothetical protein